jgi:hypothetical protein
MKGLFRKSDAREVPDQGLQGNASLAPRSVAFYREEYD